jgi:hypothetical protein
MKKDLKIAIIGWISSIIGILLGGFLLCFPQIAPFAIVLMVTSGIIFVCLGVVAVFMKADLL